MAAASGRDVNLRGLGPLSLCLCATAVTLISDGSTETSLTAVICLKGLIEMLTSALPVFTFGRNLEVILGSHNQVPFEKPLSQQRLNKGTELLNNLNF